MSLLQVLSSSIPNDVFRYLIVITIVGVVYCVQVSYKLYVIYYREVCFCHSDSSHYLMMTSKRHFHMWNLLTYNSEGRGGREGVKFYHKLTFACVYLI